MENNEWFHLHDTFHQISFVNKKGIEQSYFYDTDADYFYYEFDNEGMVDINAGLVPDEMKRTLAVHLAEWFSRNET